MSDLSIHPAAESIRTLERFGIPFAVFARDGRQTYLSREARALLDPRTAPAIQFWRQVGAAIAAGRTTALRDRLPDGGAVAVTLRPVPDGGAQYAYAAVLGPVPDGEPIDEEGDGGFGLTPREAAVARLIATGLSNKEIGAALGISIHTARRHTERIYQKLGVSSRARVAHLLARRSSSRAAVA